MPEVESEIEAAVKAVEIKIAELNLKPGSKLAMIAPESWTPYQIARFQHHADEVFKARGYEFELLVFPPGSELLSVSPSGGFEE